MFGPAAILVHLARGNSNLSAAVKSLLVEDEESAGTLNAVHDAIEEEGGFHPMQSVEKDGKYLFLTVTHYFVGRVVGKSFTDVTIDHASWVPETGQYSEVMRTGNLAEAEQTPPNVKIHLNTAVIVCAIEWPHKLPGEEGATTGRSRRGRAGAAEASENAGEEAEKDD